MKKPYIIDEPPCPSMRPYSRTCRIDGEKCGAKEPYKCNHDIGKISSEDIHDHFKNINPDGNQISFDELILDNDELLKNDDSDFTD